ncbi:CoA protein activase [Chloroflexota bacterium]
MRIAIPHLGNLYIALEALFKRLDVDYISPPPITQRTLSLAVRQSPEGLCIPFKLTLGNLIEVAELGADTIVMPGGYGTCRLGYYARIQEKILRDMGYDIEMVQMGVSEQKLIGLLAIIKRLANDAPWTKIVPAFNFCIKKLNALDRIERIVQKVRAVEMVKGTADRLYKEAVTAIHKADDSRSLKTVEAEYTHRLNQISINPEYDPLIVGITGEFYVLLEPFSNLDIESELGKLGVEVRRTTFTSGWVNFTMFLNPLGVDEKERIHRAALPYLKRDIGGDGWESIGEKVLHSGEYDGLVHLAPFTCMPEIVAQNIMPKTKENIPVLTIICDEQITKTGMLTRLEAFVDLLEHKRRNGDNSSKKAVMRGSM